MAKKRPSNRFHDFAASLPDGEREALGAYFRSLEQHLQLPGEWKSALLRDFENAILYCRGRGDSLAETLRRLAPENLGGFYSRPAAAWYPLDNAAKIYPLSMSHNQMSVFRLSVHLTEPVVPELLQIALTFTIKRFPFFATTIKRGFFWHYIDSAKRRFPVEEERDAPCAPMNVALTGSPSFRVLYYKNRVSVEFFHILTDGTGGMVFLKSLTAEYLRLMGCPVPATHGVLDVNDVPLAGESADDFPGNVSGHKSSGFVDRPAIQMSGALSRQKPCQIIHFDLDSAALRDLCHRKGCSVTAFFVAMMFLAVRAATEEPEGMVHIQVPVNMRSYYESRTIRNFALYVSVRLNLREITSLDELIPKVAKQLRENITPEAMQEMMNGAVGLVRALKLIPLFVKAPVARIVYGFLGDRVFTTTLSNLGVVDMPEELRAHVQKMDFVLGTANLARAVCSAVTAGDVCSFSVAKLTADPSFEERVDMVLRENGLIPKISGSELYGF